MKKPEGKVPSGFVAEENSTVSFSSNCSFNMARHHLKGHHGRMVSLATDSSTCTKIASSCGKLVKCVVELGPWQKRFEELVAYREVNVHCHVAHKYPPTK